MTLDIDLKNQIGTVLKMTLEDESLEDFLERFDLTPEEVFLHLYESGLIDPERFESFLLNG